MMYVCIVLDCGTRHRVLWDMSRVLMSTVEAMIGGSVGMSKIEYITFGGGTRG